MALETFDSDDTLDDGEAYGQFTNQEGNSGNGYTDSGKYKSYHDGSANNHGYLVTTADIGSTFDYQVEFNTSTSGLVLQHCGIYLGASAPTSNFNADDTSTSLVDVFIRRTDSTYRLEVTRTSSGGSRQYWNFSTNSWQSGETSWDSLAASNDYRITITRDGTNTVITIYDITGDTLIETITAVNADTKAIGDKAYFYFGAVEYGGAYASTVEWDNAGYEEAAAEENTMMIQQVEG